MNEYRDKLLNAIDRAITDPTPLKFKILNHERAIRALEAKPNAKSEKLIAFHQDRIAQLKAEIAKLEGRDVVKVYSTPPTAPTAPVKPAVPATLTWNESSLAALAESVFGRGTVRSLGSNVIERNEEIGKELAASQHSEYLRSEVLRKLKATPTAGPTMEKLTRLFYTRGLVVPGLSCKGMEQLTATQRAQISCDRTREIAQTRINDFVAGLKGEVAGFSDSYSNGAEFAAQHNLEAK